MEVSKLLNMPQSTYSGYEAGTRKASISIIKKLSVFFGVTPDYLILGNIDKHGSNHLNSSIHNKLDLLDADDQRIIEGTIDVMLKSAKYEGTATTTIA